MENEKKTATAANGTILEVGKRYRREYWNNEDSVEFLDIGKDQVWAISKDGDKCNYHKNNNWLPYEEPKPIEETWVKTMDLRFNETNNWSGFKTVLQQKQVSNLGNKKWVNVETIING